MPGKQKLQYLRIANRAVSIAGVILALFTASACNSSLSSKNASDEMAGATRASKNVSAASNPDPGIDLNCVYDHLKNPPESFHYFYKKADSNGFNVDQEADFTPLTIDGFRVQPDGSHQPIHAVSSDSSGWQAALAGLTGISGMSGTVSTFNNSSAMKREPDGGVVNGYQTIHYSIDTARWDANTRQMLGNFALGPGGFDKGDVWVTSAGCPVKFVLDDEMHKKDGSFLDKVHYEESMVKQ